MRSNNSSLGNLAQIVAVAGLKVLILLAWAAGGTRQAIGSDYYVGGAGASDGNPGTASQPFATIQKAASVAVAGDFVKIRAGTYRETITPANSGTPGHPITYQPDGKGVVTVSGADAADGGWTVYRGNVYQKTIALPVTGYRERITGNATLLANQVFTTDSNSTDVTLEGLKAQYISHFVTVRGLSSHNQETGLRLMGARSVIKNSIVEYSAGMGIALGSAGAVADNNLVHDISYGGAYCCGIWPAPGRARQAITRNTIYRTGRSGIDGVYSNKDIGYNDIYDFGLINTDLGAIYAANGADLTGTRVHHNWLHDAKNDASHEFPVGAGIYFDQDAKPAQVDHNVFWNNHKNDVRLEQGSAPFHRIFNNTMASWVLPTVHSCLHRHVLRCALPMAAGLTPTAAGHWSLSGCCLSAGNACC